MNVDFAARIPGIYYVVTKVWFEMCRKNITCDKNLEGFTIRFFFPLCMCRTDACNYLNYIDEIYKLNKHLSDADLGR